MYADLFQEDPNKNKRTGIIVFLFCLAILMAMASTCSGQVYKATDIPMILGRTDSISRLELLTAKKFHQKLNEYRKQKDVSPVRWSDTLYIVAMNHNAWMALNNIFSHTEFPFNYNFTGTLYGDRLDYVLDTKTIGCLENLAFFSWGEGTMEQMAETGALTALTMWKNDKPHNDLMISPSCRVHGIHFSPKGGYCTSEFYGIRLVKN